MNLFKVVTQVILVYIVYRLIVNFVLPVFRSITRFNKNVQQMQQNMEQQQRRFNQSQQNAAPNEKDAQISKDEGEYIEFEEVK